VSNLNQQGLFPSEESLPEVSPARISRWLANVPVLPDGAPAYFGRLLDSWTNLHRPTLSSKTFPAFCHLTEDETWEPSSGRFQVGGTVSHGVCLTLNTSEFPSDAVESSLSDVLETTGPHLAKYSLSAKACEGILRRAERRGKKLPEILDRALRQHSSQCEREVRGGGKGPLISEDMSLTLATGNGQVLIDSAERERANCLPASLYHHGTVVNQDVDSGHLVVHSDKPALPSTRRTK
jgi:hypothetical protein